MKLAVTVILLALGTVARSESCPSSDEISPCECEDTDGDSILVTCSGESVGIDDLKRAMSSLVGKRNVELELDDLHLGTLPSDFFAGIGIRILDLSHCELDALSEDDSKRPLQGLEDSLEELIILSSFTEDNVPAMLRLDHLRNLREVDLSYNSITELSDDWFGQGLPSLESVYFSNNFIENLGDRAFANLEGLKRLSLDGNRFGDLKRSMLPRSAGKLEVLELDNNALTSIPEDLFSNMPRLTEVSLRTNGIARLEERTWRTISQQLDVVRLEGNPLECDSHLTWLHDVRSTTAIFGRCEFPRDKQGLTLQEFIDNQGRKR